MARINMRQVEAFRATMLTGSVTEACRKAHVGRGTIYYWKPRFEEQGYAGLEAFERRGPKEPQGASPDVERKVTAVRRKHPDWGKKRIADELAKANNWCPRHMPKTGISVSRISRIALIA